MKISGDIVVRGKVYPAVKDPSARYLLVRDGVMYSQIYERFASGWIQIRNMLGFADDESADLFQAEIRVVKSTPTLTFTT